MKTNRIAVWVFVLFAIVLFNLFRMQILKGGYYRSLSERNRVRVIYLEGARGKVMDRHGEAIATSRLSFNCSAVWREARKEIGRTCQILSPILKVPAETLEERFNKKKPGAFQTVLLAEDIESSQAVAIEEKLDLLPGVLIETRPLRVYPIKEDAAHLVGYIGPMTEEETDRLEEYGYRSRDWIGRDGIEQFYESYLRGRSGGLQMEVDSRGRFVRALGVKEPSDGKDIQLTVDMKLQAYVQDLLGRQRGAVIVMDLKDGGILSVNSAPSFDPNLFASAMGRKEVGKYLSGAGSPMLNRGIRGQYPPGSIYKIVTAFAALESGKISARSHFNCPGYFIVGGNRFRCWKETGHGPQGLSDAFAHSCNVYFYTAGILTGIDSIYAKSVEFGFSKLTGIDLPNEKKGFVPSREWKRRARGQSWFDGETANLAIGQGYLQVTPLQALVMTSAMATRGELVKPHLIDKIEGVKVAEKNTRSMPMDLAIWKAVEEGLTAVVNSDTGTGRLARIAGKRVAGKTGTAESGQDKTHAWFVGFAPEEEPKVAMVVFLEHGGRGGVVAARLGGEVFRWLKEANYL